MTTPASEQETAMTPTAVSARDYERDTTDRYIVPDTAATAVRLVRGALADTLDWLGDTRDRWPYGGVRPETYVREHLPTVWEDLRGVKRLETDRTWPRAIVFDPDERPWAELTDPRTGEVVSVKVAAWVPMGGRWVPTVELPAGGGARQYPALDPSVVSGGAGVPW